MPFLYVVAGLILLIVLHELGHFLAARRVGVKATKFYVFFPPALWKRQFGDVEVGVGSIPAGGFVKLPGMFEPRPPEVAERLRWRLKDVREAVGMTPGGLELDAALRGIETAPDADALVGELTRVEEALATVRTHVEAEEAMRVPATAGGGELEEEGTGRAAASPAHLLAVLDRADGEVRASIDDAAPGAYWRAALWRRMVVITAGPLVNVLLAAVLFFGFYLAWIPEFQITAPIGLAEVTESSPAERAGIELEDRIVEWDGPVVGQAPAEVLDRLDDTMAVTWIDADTGEERSATLRAELLEQDVEDGIGEPRERTGIRFELDGSNTTVTDRYGLPVADAARATGNELWSITWGNLSRLVRVPFDSEVREDVSSVVGIVQFADDVDAAGQMLRYVAVISLILGVLNMLPLLPLDGGHVLFGILEKLRGGRVMPREAFERYSAVGLTLVMLLFLVGLNNDVTNPK